MGDETSGRSRWRCSRNVGPFTLATGLRIVHVDAGPAYIDDALLCLKEHGRRDKDMRTTLDLPEPLVLEAQSILGFKSKTDTVIQS